MNGIFQKLPSLASDYSGAGSVLFEMGGMTVFCDAGSCFGTFLILDDPRWHAAPQRLFSASLREQDIVLGFDKKLIKKIENAYHAVGGSFLALIGTPVPSIVGTDYKGICRELEKKLPVGAVGIDTTGMDLYERGQTKCYLELVQRFADPQAPACGDVHVIGATPLDMWDMNQTGDMLRFLRDCGAENPVVWGGPDSLESIRGISRSRLNIAVSVSAIPVVRKLEEQYGTPYLVGFPIGRKDTACWKGCVTGFLRGEAPAKLPAVTPGNGKRVLIVGEQVASESLRRLLEGEFSCQVDVASCFTMDPSLMRKGDAGLSEEDSLARLMQERERYDVVAADPMLLRLMGYQPDTVIQLPHIAVSSRVFWNKSPNCFGDKGSDYFSRLL